MLFMHSTSRLCFVSQIHSAMCLATYGVQWVCVRVALRFRLDGKRLCSPKIIPPKIPENGKQNKQLVRDCDSEGNYAVRMATTPFNWMAPCNFFPSKIYKSCFRSDYDYLVLYSRIHSTIVHRWDTPSSHPTRYHRTKWVDFWCSSLFTRSSSYQSSSSPFSLLCKAKISSHRWLLVDTLTKMLNDAALTTLYVRR